MSYKAFELQNYIDKLYHQLTMKRKVYSDSKVRNLSEVELKVVLFVGKQGTCIMKEISGHLFIAKNNLTAIVSKLESKKILKRERSESDGRIILVSLTEEGLYVFRDEMQMHYDFAISKLSRLSEEEQHHFLTLMSKIAT